MCLINVSLMELNEVSDDFKSEAFLYTFLNSLNYVFMTVGCKLHSLLVKTNSCPSVLSRMISKFGCYQWMSKPSPLKVNNLSSFYLF